MNKCEAYQVALESILQKTREGIYNYSSDDQYFCLSPQGIKYLPEVQELDKEHKNCNGCQN